MNTLIYRSPIRVLSALIVATAFLMMPLRQAYSLTIGEVYTISIEKINSDGTLTTGATSLGLSTTATTDANGKLAFTFSSSIPDNSSCNFMVITLKNSSGATERQTVVPCPASGATIPLGVSNVTNKQAAAMIAAFAAASSDDPIMAVFGFTIVRSEGISSAELVFMANLISQGISGANGFVADMTSKGVTASQLVTYRSAIVAKLADPTTGYSKLLKDSVDVSSAADKTLEAAKRGEAAAKLLGYLVKAASDAGFSQDRVLEAFNAMGGIVVPLMATAVADGNLTAATKQSIDSTVGGGIQKLNADRAVEIYTQALTTLGATGTDLSTFQTAASALIASMSSAFQAFDKVFTGSETQAAVAAADAILNTAMNAAFTAFTSATASSNARITTMIANIDSALGVSTGLTLNEFQYYKSNGSPTNWPVMMVIPTDWMSSVKSAGGSVTYTRDSLSIPASMTWIGTCSNNTDNDSGSCAANGATWTTARTNYAGQGIPSPYADLFGIQEDVMIREFARFAAQNSAGMDMSAQNTLEKAFSDGIGTIAGNISGTTNGTTAISTAQKKALVELMKSPQF